MINNIIKKYFSKENISIINNSILINNPITIQILGICSSLAVTNKLSSALVMSFSVIVVLSIGSIIISIIRNIIPKSIRIIIQLLIISSLVIFVDQFLMAFYYNISKQISVFISLIITNCIVMGRFEAFALKNKPWISFLDGLGNSIGYSIILIIIAFFRELIGFGTILGFEVLGNPINKTGFYYYGYCNNSFMSLSPIALITMGIIIWIQKSKTKC